MSATADRNFLRLLILGMKIACGLALLHAALLAQVMVPIDYNEGWNAYHAASAIAGVSPYPDAAGMMINNYPPLSFYIVGAFGQYVGDQIIAGRIISLLSFVGIAWCIRTWIAQIDETFLAAEFAVLLFMGALLALTHYVGMNDPQMLGHLFDMMALLLLVRERRNLLMLAGGALFLAAAVFVKHNLIVLPLAILIWLSIYDRRDALVLAGIGLVLGAAGLLATNELLHTDLLAQLLTSRAYNLQGVFHGAELWLLTGLVPFVAIVLLLFKRHSEPAMIFVALYLGLAACIGIALSGGAGVDANAMFDAFIASALATGAALTLIKNKPPLTMVLAGLAVAPLAVVMSLNANASWLSLPYWQAPKQTELTATARDVSFLAQAGNPVFCEMLSLCYWAGAPAAVDVFNLSQAIQTGARGENDLLALIDARQFRAVQMSSLTRQAFSYEIQAAFARNYRVDHEDANGVFMVPR